MAELFEEVVALLESRSSTRALAMRFRIESQQVAGNGVALCVPILIAELSRWADDSTKSASPLKTLRSIDTFGLHDPGAAIEGNLYEPVGSKLTDTLLGDRRRAVAKAISEEAGIGRQSADCLLPPAAWALLASIADRHGNRIGRQSLANLLGHELDGLYDAGWGPWLEAVGFDEVEDPSVTGDYTLGYGGGYESDQERYGMTAAYDTYDVADTFDTFGTDGEREVLAEGPYGDDDRYGTVDSHEAYAGHDYGAGGYGSAGGPTFGETPQPETSGRSSLFGSGRGPGPGAGQRRGLIAPRVDDALPEEAAPSRIPLVLAAVAVVLIGILGVYQLIGGDTDDATTAVGLGEGVETEDDQDQVGPDPFRDDGQEGFAEGGDAVALNIVVSDPQGLSGAVGALELRFDVAAGEVCYNVMADLLAAPYEGHLHAGALGQSGEVVVAFGRLNNGDFGCAQVDGVRLEQVLNDRANHYVDLHDATAVASIRAQLSEATEAGGQGTGDPGEGQIPTGIQYEPRGDGAFFRIEPGRLILTGLVADQATADRMAVEVADLADAGLEIVDELTIVAGAPVPSGRITMNNAGLFQLGSDQLAADRSSVIIDVATVLLARPTWRVTIIGHTDATGSEELNLSLSLGRATAVVDELVANGVTADRMMADGAGSSQPIADNSTPDGQAQNRRTEFIVDRG